MSKAQFLIFIIIIFLIPIVAEIGKGILEELSK